MDDLVNREGLALYLKENLTEYSGEFEVVRIGQGQSCLTFLIKGDNWQIVLRRPPRGELPPTAFDTTREYRVMSALHRVPSQAGSSVPVPRTLSLCEDPSVIGAKFYLMENVDGVVIRGSIPEPLDNPEDRRRMSEQLVDTLVALHSVDYRAIGLSEFGKPEGYLERQLRRMNQLWELAKFREIPQIDELYAWLLKNLPTQYASTIVHGDYKLDNVMLAPTSPARIVAVVDWEISTLGDPLADVGWLLFFWREVGEDPTTSASMPLDGGFMTRRELLDRYVEKARVPEENISWYAALGGWKIAIIMEGSYKRFRGGVKDHPGFAALEQGVIALADRAVQATRGELGI